MSVKKVVNKTDTSTPIEYQVGVGASKPFYTTLYRELADSVYATCYNLGYKRAYIDEVPSYQIETLRREFSS